MASARRTGVNESVSTYGVSRDYSSLSTWEAATDTDLVTAAQSQILECYDDAASFNDNVGVSGATTNGSYFRIIRPASGQGHNGTPTVGVYFSSSPATVWNLNENNFHLQDIIYTNTRTGAGNTFGVFVGTSTGTCVGVIDWDSTSADANQCFANEALANFILCSAITHGGRGFFNRASTGRHYNCLAVNDGGGAAIGFQRDIGTMIAKNCLADDTAGGTCFSGTFSSSNNNASTDTTAPGTSSRTSQTFTFVNAAGDDYHLASGDAGAKDFGADLSADASFAFDDDIDKNLFGTWDIGFDEPTSAVAFLPRISVY